MNNSTISILAQDLFKLLDMDALEASEKELFLSDFLKTVSRYFFQEKLGKVLSAQEKETLATKYESLDQENIYALMEEMSNRIENVEELYTEALVYVKSQVVKDFYKDKVGMLEKLVAEEEDVTVKQNLSFMLSLAKKKLDFALNERYDQIINISNTEEI
ncbi:MAG TPA: hypothetical protein PLV59_00345 [Candidatus Dojkabacteria bacterium]|nr:hypothetical protein [Candidatus Dojkabacteria bacterium]